MVGPFEKGLLTCQRFKRRHNFFSCKTHPHVCVTFIRKPSGPLTLPGLHYWLLTGGAGQRGDPRCPINHLFSTAAYFQSFLFSLGTKKNRRWGWDRRPPLITQVCQDAWAAGGERGQETPRATEGQKVARFIIITHLLGGARRDHCAAPLLKIQTDRPVLAKRVSPKTF